ELNAEVADATFKVELVCIVDSNDKGMMITRTENKNIMLPGTIFFHWMKRLFEWLYLRKYR
ncbi:MAG: NAD(P)/FAD-dependent oxidoreductase, partial [Gammaproteobacteria bacterium]|nr:NAD(P)/FAD-dependent oxidoreductase [Gammaproteobacteria bacterium]